MNNLIDSRLFNVLLMITIIGEFLLPWILKHFYKDYNSKTMVMSVLGSPESPVRKIYNVWLVWLGAFFFTNFILVFQRGDYHFNCFSGFNFYFDCYVCVRCRNTVRFI